MKKLNSIFIFLFASVAGQIHAQKVTLISSDNKKFTIDRDVALVSETIKNLLPKDLHKIPQIRLFENGETIQRFIPLMQMVASKKEKKAIWKEINQYINRESKKTRMSSEWLLKLLNAASYLNTPFILDTLAELASQRDHILRGIVITLSMPREKLADKLKTVNLKPELFNFGMMYLISKSYYFRTGETTYPNSVIELVGLKDYQPNIDIGEYTIKENIPGERNIAPSFESLFVNDPQDYNIAPNTGTGL